VSKPENPSAFDRAWLNDLQQRINSLRTSGEDYLILSVGVRGPNFDCEEGNAVATVRIGNDTATSEALYLDDAIRLARGKIQRERAAREAKRAKDQSTQKADPA